MMMQFITNYLQARRSLVAMREDVPRDGHVQEGTPPGIACRRKGVMNGGGYKSTCLDPASIGRVRVRPSFIPRQLQHEGTPQGMPGIAGGGQDVFNSVSCRLSWQTEFLRGRRVGTSRLPDLVNLQNRRVRSCLPQAFNRLAC